MKTDLYNQKNEVVGTVELPDQIFAVPWRADLVHEVLRAQRANERHPWGHAKSRGEVRGGGRKPWRQKGTGRARHGSIRSPLWRGGGKAHGPRKERDYSLKVNKKAKRLALSSVLSKKLHDKEIKVVNALELEAPKTNIIAKALRPLLGLSRTQKKYDLLLLRSKENKALPRAAANLPKTKAITSGGLNVYDLLTHRHLVIEEKAISELVAHWSPKTP